MAKLDVEFCGLNFKNPMVVASLEPTNSPDLMKQCFDAGAAGAIIKTLTDIKDMARLTENSKYCIMNQEGEIIEGKVPRDFVFYSRSGYSNTYYKNWIPYLKENADLCGRTRRPSDRQRRGRGCRRLDGYLPQHRGSRPAHGGAEFRLSASGHDARRPWRQHDRPGARPVGRGDAHGLRGDRYSDHDQADAEPGAGAGGRRHHGLPASRSISRPANRGWLAPRALARV